MNPQYLEVTNLMKNDVANFMERTSSIIQGFAYEGFNAAALFNKILEQSVLKGRSKAQLAEDMGFAIVIFHYRGPNLSKMVKENTKNPELFTKLSSLANDYKILSNPKEKADAITLPRISMVFPRYSWDIHVKILTEELTSPVTEKEVFYEATTMLYGNYVPCLISKSSAKYDDTMAMSFMLHNMYQCVLSFKTQKKDDKDYQSSAGGYLYKAVEYSCLAQDGSIASEEDMKNIESFTKEKSGLSAPNMRKSMIKFFDPIPKISCDLEPTKFQTILNYCIVKGYDLTHVPDADWSLPFKAISVKYGKPGQ